MKKEFKVGDKVAVNKSKITGMIVDIKENRYIIELDEALPIRSFMVYGITFYVDPRTFIVRVEVKDASHLDLMDGDGVSTP
jgi:hypothetical protein